MFPFFNANDFRELKKKKWPKKAKISFKKAWNYGKSKKPKMTSLCYLLYDKGIVFCFGNCSNLLREKYVLVNYVEKLEAEITKIYKNFEITRNSFETEYVVLLTY